MTAYLDALDARVTACPRCDGPAWDGALCGPCRKSSCGTPLEVVPTPLAGLQDFLSAAPERPRRCA